MVYLPVLQNRLTEIKAYLCVGSLIACKEQEDGIEANQDASGCTYDESI